MRLSTFPIAFMALAFLACGQPQRVLQAEPSGTAHLKFRMALPPDVSAEEVREGRLTISAPDMDTLEVGLEAQGSALVGWAEAVPTGAGRLLEVRGADARGRRIVAGAMRMDVEAGESGEASIIVVTLQRVGTVRLDATFDTTLPE
jgi:hypothetical protein